MCWSYNDFSCFYNVLAKSRPRVWIPCLDSLSARRGRRWPPGWSRSAVCCWTHKRPLGTWSTGRSSRRPARTRPDMRWRSESASVGRTSSMDRTPISNAGRWRTCTCLRRRPRGPTLDLPVYAPIRRSAWTAGWPSFWLSPRWTSTMVAADHTVAGATTVRHRSCHAPQPTCRPCQPTGAPWCPARSGTWRVPDRRPPTTSPAVHQNCVPDTPARANRNGLLPIWSQPKNWWTLAARGRGNGRNHHDRAGLCTRNSNHRAMMAATWRTCRSCLGSRARKEQQDECCRRKLLL